MSGDRIINTGGGNYNELIQGNYIQGDYINLNQDLAQVALQIQQLLLQLQTKGYRLEEAQEKIANSLATKAKNDSISRNQLEKLGRYLTSAATNGLIGEAAVEAIKFALRMSGIPL